MGITVNDVRRVMDQWAPFDSALEMDNVGLLIGDGNVDVRGILIALDLTMEVVEEALSCGANLIITHHPVIFYPMKAITPTSAQGKLTKAVLQANLSVICAHTNLDGAQGGVSDTLAQAVGLVDIKSVAHNPLLRLCRLPKPMALEEFAAAVRQGIDAQVIQVCGPAPDVIRTVVVVGGRGGSFMDDAISTGADLYLLGEIKHENGLYAQVMEQCVMSAGHYETETVVLNVVKGYLQKQLFDVQLEGCVQVTNLRTGPFSVIK